MANVLHSNLSGGDLHDPKSHASAHASGASDAITIAANQVSNFDVEVSNNTDVAANTAATLDTICGRGSTTSRTIGASGLSVIGDATISDTLDVDNLIVTEAYTPPSGTATGTTGRLSWDADNLYICTATNTWKKVTLAELE